MSQNARMVTVLPELKSSSMISLGKLFDDNCDILLNKKKMYVVKDKEVILEGTTQKLDGIWDVLVSKINITSKNYKSTQAHT